MMRIALLAVAVVASSANSADAGVTGRIAFGSDRDGNNNIYVMDGSGGNHVRLADHPGDDVCPVFSPDGGTIAFLSNRAGPYQIYTMNWDGSGLQPVPNSQAEVGSGWRNGRSLAWSPDGQRLLFRAASDSLGYVNRDGTGRTVFWSGAVLGHGYIQGVEWGPTGNDIYVNAQNPGWGYDQHVFRYPLSGGGWTQVTTETQPLHSHGPKVSPALSRIVLDRSEDWQGPYNIYRMDLAGGSMTKLTFDSGATFNNGPDWAENGGAVLFSSNRGGGGDQIWAMDSAGGNLEMLPGPGNNFTPSWSPVPEPATLGLLAVGGAAGACWIARRRGRQMGIDRGGGRG